MRRDDLGMLIMDLPIYSFSDSEEATFWTEGDATMRRIFLMPTGDGSGVAALGVLAPSNQVLFVARGGVEGLGAFITMARDEAHVELYAQAPVPEDFLIYTIPGERETQVLHPPPDPNGPSRPGDVLSSLWREGDATTRKTYLMPLSNPAEFLAFGVISNSNTPHFVVRGLVKDDLPPFIDRMVRDGANVKLYAQAPLPDEVVRQYTSGSSIPLAPEHLVSPWAGEAHFKALRA
jgi:hypothetical protein